MQGQLELHVSDEDFEEFSDLKECFDKFAKRHGKKLGQELKYAIAAKALKASHPQTAALFATARSKLEAQRLGKDIQLYQLREQWTGMLSGMAYHQGIYHVPNLTAVTLVSESGQSVTVDYAHFKHSTYFAASDERVDIPIPDMGVRVDDAGNVYLYDKVASPTIT